MIITKLHLPKSRPHQQKVMLDPNRFKVVCCGRRWGKTDAAFQAIVLGHGPTRGSFPGLIDGAELAWVVPVKRNARKAWKMLKKATAKVWGRTKSEIDKRIELPNSGAVSVVSTSEPDNIRSEGYDGMVFDEAAFAKPGVWKNVLRPMLVDKVGWCIFITSPNGHNWFERDVWKKAENRKGWARWQLPTSDNPYISKAELAEALLDLGPHEFAREHLAQFTTQEGAEFPPDWFGEGIWFDEFPTADIDSTVITLDPSLGRNDKADYSAYTIMKRHKSGLLYCDFDLEKRVATKMVDDGIRLAKTHCPDVFGVESIAFQSLLSMIFMERSKKSGMMLPLLDVEHQGVSKETRIRRLTPYLSRGEILFKRDSPGAEMAVEQLQAFPVGENDDGPDSLEMAKRITYQYYSEMDPHSEETPDAAEAEY